MQAFKKPYLVAIIVVICNFNFAYGQNSKHTALSSILENIEEKFGVDILIDKELIQSVEVESMDLSKDLITILNELNSKTAFTFELVDNNSVVASPVKPGANTKISLYIREKDSETLIAGVLVSTKNGTQGSISDSSGSVVIYGKFSPDDTLVAQAIGYARTYVPITLVNKGTKVAISLTPLVHEMEDIEIINYNTRGITSNTTEHSLEIDIEDLALIAGEIESDVLQSIRILPGMSSPTGRAGELNMRGSTSDQSIIYFDGIPLYHSGHFHGTLSPFNPFVVDKIKVFRNGHTTDLDGRVGGTIVIDTENEIPDSARYGIISSTIFGGAYTSIPIIKNKLGLTVSGRHNIPGFTSPKLRSTQDVAQAGTFSHLAQELEHQDVELDKFTVADLNGKLIYEPHKDHHIELSGLYISNDLNTHITENELTKLYDYKVLDNWGVRGLWNYQLSDRIQSKISVVKSNFKYNSVFDIYDTTGVIERTSYFNTSIDDFSTKASIEYTPAKKSIDLFTFGVEYKWNNSKQETLNLGPSSSTVISNSILRSYSLFSSYKYNGKNVKLVPGFRTYYLPIGDYYRFEPRLKASYFLGENTILKGSYGKYSQVSNLEYEVNFDVYIYTNYFWDLANNQVPLVKSDIIMLGATHETGSWIFDIEAYQKRTDDIFYRYQPDYFKGSAYTNGIDFMIRKKWSKLNIWTSYTLSETVLDFPDFSNVPFLTHFDQTHQFHIGSVYETGQWSFALSWRYASGIPNYLGGKPIPFIPPSNPPLNLDPENPTLNDGRFGDQHQLDASVALDFPKKQAKWKGNLSISLMNIYDRNNVIETLNHRQAMKFYLLDRSNMRFTPNLQLKFEW